VLRPRADQLQQTVAELRRVTPRGMGRSYGDASLGVDGSIVLVTDDCQRVLALDRQTGKITAEAGVSLQAIIDAVLPHGWFLPVTPGTRFVSLGGAIAGNVHGKNHHSRGAIEKHIDALSIVTESGPVTCSPSEKDDLFRATLGGFGMTGVVESASLQLLPVETAWIETLNIKASDLDTLLATLAKHEPDYEYSITWIDTTTGGRSLGRGVVMLGRHAAKSSLPAALQQDPLAHHWKPARSVPSFGGWAINHMTTRCLNLAFYHSKRRAPRHGLSPIESYFYPLDAIRNWNVLYGKQGFLQYQLVLPDAGDARTGIRRVLELLVKRRVGSFVSGLKRMRADENLLPFGMEGYTFGIDFGFNYAGIKDVMNELDRIVMDYGGRVCLSKDSRLTPETFRQMYPELGRWREAVQKYVPSGRFTSRLAERLRLLEP
jgi:FAD/FMN-containing dehydrogenase